ncbi:MAG: D-alanyl-D-alanine carboxypeptidase [Ruminococcaceae bacterium]|nr:D-alanyl-D-alanine carboxypeptidase [Oscillospiraceae bacterium]
MQGGFEVLFKKIVSFLLILTFTLSVFSIESQALYNSSVELESDIVLLASIDDGTILLSKNQDKRTPPASLTKIVTASIVLQHCTDPDEIIEADEASIQDISGTGSSNANIKVGEKMSVKDLLYCLLVHSANEAANILGTRVAGSIPEFVKMMNEYVVDLGCKNTHFVNCHGLDDEEQYTTAEDMLVITLKALEIPEFKEITSTVKYTVPKTNMSDERYLYTTNWMMNPGHPTYYYEYVSGVKTGTTSRAGRCIISTASKDGYNYIGIVMGAKNEDSDENAALLECKKIFKWAFENIKLSTVVSANSTVTVIDVELSTEADHLRLVPSSDMSLLVPTGNDENSVMVKVIDSQTPKSVSAPIKKGDPIGKAQVLYADEEIAVIDLVAAENISRSPILWFFHLLKEAFSSTAFKLIVLAAVTLIIVYFILLIRYKKKKRRKRQSVKTVKMNPNSKR